VINWTVAAQEGVKKDIKDNLRILGWEWFQSLETGHRQGRGIKEGKELSFGHTDGDMS
jgi:hypothetical protein